MKGLKQLVKDHPNSERYQLALIEYKLSRDPGNRKLLKELHAFVINPRYTRQASATWRRAVFRLDEVPASIPYYKEYLAYSPGDTGIQDIYKKVVARQAAYAKLLKDPAFQKKLQGLKLLDENRPVEAEEALTIALKSRPRDGDALGAMGIIRMRQGRHEEAIAYFRQALKYDDPDYASKWRSLIKTTTFWGYLSSADNHMEQNQLDAAEQDLFKAFKLHPDDPEVQLSLAELRIRQQRFTDAEDIYKRGMTRTPVNGRFVKGLFSLYVDQGRDQQAKELLSTLDQEQINSLGTSYNRFQATLLETDADLLLAAIAESSDAAQNKIDLLEAIQKLEQAHQYRPDDPWLLLDLARLYRRAGFPPEKGKQLFADALPRANKNEMSEFGQALFCYEGNTSGVDCSKGSNRQQDKGVTLGAGYIHGRWGFDIGTTPLGFAVQDVVGGIRYDGDYKQFYWGVDVSRRPMVGTLLSYAGTEDIRTGEVWGGVRTNGVTFSLGHDKGKAFGFWSHLDLDHITGKNVAANNRFRLMGGLYYRLINQEDQEFSIGLNGHLWRYEESYDEFTFGQGGYYSPNKYQSLAIPLDLTGRVNDRLSYRSRVSGSFSWSYEKTTPFYPDNDDLQAQAEALYNSDPANEINPYFDGSHGSGFGYALLGALEYKVSDHWAIGTELSMDDSDYYEPRRAMAYFKYYFDINKIKVIKLPTHIPSYSDF